MDITLPTEHLPRQHLLIGLAVAVHDQPPRSRASSLAVVALALLGMTLMLARRQSQRMRRW